MSERLTLCTAGAVFAFLSMFLSSCGLLSCLIVGSDLDDFKILMFALSVGYLFPAIAIIFLIHKK